MTKKWWEDKNNNSDEEEENDKDKPKWKSLEHHGVTFFPSYKPHGVKVLHKVRSSKLSILIGRSFRFDT